jgi:Phytanoyl-CoA dioxygenase (PhyH)
MTAIVNDFIETGMHQFDFPIEQSGCANLLGKVRSSRRFLSQEDFDANPQFKGVNPTTGRNLLHVLSSDVQFLEKDPRIVSGLAELLGPDYEILDRKFVCGVPETWLPQWLRERLQGNPVNNLGPYIKQEYRDITYFYGIDYHQDIIDWKDRSANFVTLYVYLSPVTKHDAPLYVLPGSHKFGATTFPHQLTAVSKNPVVWRYGNGHGQEMTVEQYMLTGDAGYVAMWHSALLHGTQPDTADHERISLRYLITRRDGPARYGIDIVNDQLSGPLSLSSTRVDLTDAGDAALKSNVINTVRDKV